jgi:DNA-binding NarL/FixJ family response regulator
MASSSTLFTVRGRYSEGVVRLQEPVLLEGSREVLVTFLDEGDAASMPEREPGTPLCEVPLEQPARYELQLTRREQEVLDLLQGGLTNREIAAALELSTGTIRNYTCSLYDKLKVRNRLEAVTRAAEMGLFR